MDEKVKQTMNSIFGFSQFQSSKQRDGVSAILKGDRDVFINLPPASGKTLIYHLPAILSEKKSAIVFVRNINIAKEHNLLFTGKNIKTCLIDPSTQAKIKLGRVEQLKNGKLVASVIYIPFSICKKDWIKDLITTLGRRDCISFFAVDEAIYLSVNTTMYEKSSLDIVTLRNIFPNVPLVALTSSGSNQIKCDIIAALNIKNPHEIIEDNWTLSNAYLQVKFKDMISNPYQDLFETITNYKKTLGEKKFCGIIFCQTKEETLVIAKELSRRNVTTVPYNSSLKCEKKKESRLMWKRGKAAIIATTRDSALGLVNSNVLCLIHWSMPLTIEEYYREIGRSRHHKDKTLCCLYFDLENWTLAQRITIGMSLHVHADFKKMIEFCHSKECRHVMYSKYFGTTVEKCRNFCDWCARKYDTEVSLNKFLDYQNKHRLLSTTPQKNDSSKNDEDYLHDGVYDAQNTKNIINDLKLNLRFYWYTQISNALTKNYETANDPDKKIMNTKILSRLARNLEYSTLLLSHSRGKYITTINGMIKVMDKQTKDQQVSYWILNYDCQQLNENSVGLK